MDYPGLNLANQPPSSLMGLNEQIKASQSASAAKVRFTAMADAGLQPHDEDPGRMYPGRSMDAEPNEAPPPSLNDLISANAAVMDELRRQTGRIEDVQARMLGVSHGVSDMVGNFARESPTVAQQLWRQNTMLYVLSQRITRLADGLERAA